MTITTATPPAFDPRLHGARPTDGSPLIVNFGGGVDSTAMLIKMADLGIVPDVIVFADTGAERPETLAWVETFSAWVVAHGMPAVDIVSRHGTGRQYGPASLVYRNDENGKRVRVPEGYTSLTDNCLANETLPSEAFNMGSCSTKWKQEPMDKWLASHPIILDAKARGLVPVKAIGLDAGPIDSKRKIYSFADAFDGSPACKIMAKESAWPGVTVTEQRAGKKPLEHKLVRAWYALREFDMDREECERVIRAAGLPVPLKSSCFFCPNMKEHEVRALAVDHPELFSQAVEMEDRARNGKHGLKKIDGLWRKGSAKHNLPGSWRTWAEQHADPAVRATVQAESFAGVVIR